MRTLFVLNDQEKGEYEKGLYDQMEKNGTPRRSSTRTRSRRPWSSPA